MKILLCEKSIDGHRSNYISWLSSIYGIEFFLLAPENNWMDESHYYDCSDCVGNKPILFHLKWINKIHNIVKKEKIDVVHILDGDSIMRYMGIGFSTIKDIKIVITFHNFYEGFFRKVAYKRMLLKSNQGIVHTDYIKKNMNNIGIDNIRVINYPVSAFDRIAGINTEKAKSFWGITNTYPTIGIIGGISNYKNIIEFLRILKGCKYKFNLILCGKLYGITEEEINNEINSYKGGVVARFRVLSEEEYENAIAASDIIYALYKKDFYGASGPMTDGICAKKLILGCSHGSIGDIVNTNHVGITADVSDVSDIKNRVNCAINSIVEFKYDYIAMNYRDSLKIDFFKKKYTSIYELMCTEGVI